MEKNNFQFEKLCRTCKNESDDMQNIFEIFPINGNDTFCIADMLMACSTVHISNGDGLPSSICRKCKEQLDIAYNFKQQCEFIDSTFRMLLNGIKQEYDESDDIPLNQYLTDANPLAIPEPKLDFIKQEVHDDSEGQTDDKKCKCNLCFKEYSDPSHLRRHMRTQHFPNKIFRCKICNKTLTRLEHLKRHMIIHLKNKPHVCGTCKRGFNKADNLYSHEMRCKGQRPYICPICSRGFTREDSLQVHMKSHDVNAESKPMLESLDDIDDYIQIEERDPYDLSQDDPFKDPYFEPQVSLYENKVDKSNNDKISVEYSDDDDMDFEPSSPKVENHIKNSDEEDVNVKEEASEEKVSFEVDDLSDDEFSRRRTTRGKSKKSLRMKKIKGEMGGKYACDRCGKKLASKIDLDIHKQRHSGNGKMFKCSICLKSFTRGNHLKRHVISLHEGLKPYQCHICSKTFTRNDHMLRHVKSHTHIDLFECEHCPLKFSREETLLKHKACKHGIGEKILPEKKFKCDMCDKLFTTEKYRDIHLRAHSVKTQKIVRCKVCKQQFDDKEELGKHLKEINDCSRRFLCSECGQRFTKKDYLDVHIRRHRGEKPFKCQFCNKGFPRTTDLKAHEKCHTGEKDHLCIICGKGFGRAYKLTLHMRTHTGERPYVCTYCDAAFAQSNDLKAHIRRHTGERYYCDICNDAFLMGYMLTQHKKNVHGVDLPESQKERARLNQSAPQPIKPEIRIPGLDPRTGQAAYLSALAQSTRRDVNKSKLELPSGQTLSLAAISQNFAVDLPEEKPRDPLLLPSPTISQTLLS